MQTEDELTAFVKEQAQKTEGQPYWLSMLALDLKPLGVDYKAILGEEKLKSFIKRTAGPETYRFLEHPYSKAKVGVVSTDSDFEFSVETAAPPSKAQRRTADVGEREQAVVAFFKALAKLSDEELDGIVIPTRVLVKLLARR